MAGASTAAAAPAPTDMDAYTAYWYALFLARPGSPLLTLPYRAAYGYDVNSPEFKDWQTSQMAQYKQYYSSQGYEVPSSDPAAASAGGAAAPAPPSEPAPPPPPLA
jgi:hypothetical protein